MISEVIVIGLCVNVFIVLAIWMTNKGTMEVLYRLREKITNGEQKKKVYLTSGVIEEYEIKIAALEDQPAVSVICPFPIKKETAMEANHVSAQGGLVYFKKMISKFTKNLAGSKSSFNKLGGSDCCQYLPSIRGVPGAIDVDPILSQPTGEDLSLERDKTNPVVPFSYESSNKTAFLSIKHFLKVSDESKPHSLKESLLKKVLTQSEHRPRERTKPRSKLAVKLERKLPYLNSFIESAASICKSLLILAKIEKLDRALAKKYSQAGKSTLEAILEEDE